MDQQFIHHHLNRLNSRIFILFVAGLLLGGLATLTATISFAQYGYRAGITLGSDRVQYVNPDGRNKISFAIYGQTGTVDFALHALSDAQFIEHFRQWNPYYVPDVSQLSQEVAWQETITSPNASYHDAYTTPLPDVPSGLYLLTARASQGQPDSALVVVSRLSLTMKRGPDERLMLWSTTFTTGAAVPEMEITLYDERGENKTIGHTGPDGIVKFPPAANAEQPWYLAIGRAGNEITAVGTHDDWREFGWYSSWYRKRYIVYLHTDRPLYRPGHTIYYNGFIRERVDGELVPINSATNIEVKLQDSRGNVVATEEVNADEYGAVNGEFALGNSPPLGRYHVVLTIDPGDTAFHQSQELKVEEYRKPEYEVKVTTDKPFGIAGDPVAINVDVDYFFGQPTADADVELKIYEQEYYYYDYWWEWEYYARPTNRKYVTTLKGKTDAEGHWETSFTPPGSLEHDKYYTFEALVTDALGQPVSGSASVRAHRHTFRLKVQTERYGFEVDDPVHVNVSTVTHDGQPTANRNVNVAIERRRYREPSRIIAEQQVTTDQSGKAQATFTNLPEGWYYIVATVRDDRGKFIETNRYLWIYDPNGRNWWYTSNNVLSIETDQDIYTPGDTAQLLIQSRISDTVALLTIERDTLLDEMIVPLDGPVTKVDLPITDAFAPNVYVTLQVYDRSRADNPDYTGEGELAYTRIMLHIPADHKRLNVDITPNAEKYGAGDQAEFTLKVTDRDGQPMAARLVLALVDEALLAIEADKSPVMRKTFYEETYFPELRTYGSPTRPYYAYYLAVPELPDLTPIPEALGTATPPPSTPTDDPSDESDNALTGRDDTNGSEPRRVFLDTAYWNPNITTGADGIAKVTVPLPDNLTTWRVIVKAITLTPKLVKPQATSW
ncbi:hypothetical protein KFU94_32260 [Chloroflexi bacterium TSY]|nr:hypothetical protein [Chloroflexi bacterium TSY]